MTKVKVKVKRTPVDKNRRSVMRYGVPNSQLFDYKAKAPSPRSKKWRDELPPKIKDVIWIKRRMLNSRIKYQVVQAKYQPGLNRWMFMVSLHRNGYAWAYNIESWMPR